MAQMRTPTPNSMVILDGDKTDQTFATCRPTSSGKKRVIRREGSSTSLEILPPEDKENDRHSLGKKKSSHSTPEGASSSRPSSRSSRAPPVSRPDSAGRRPSTPGTPTRQVVLQAVRRKQDKDEDYGPLDLEPQPDFTVKKPSPGYKKSEKRERKVKSADRKAQAGSASAKPDESDHKHKEKEKKAVTDLGDLENSDQYDTDLDDASGSDSDEEEEEKPTAPTELMLEFLDCIYKKEWPIAKNLCRMILMYEPENEDANKFAGLIEEKLKIVAERGSDEETGDEDDSDDDSDSDGDSDDTDDDDDRKRKKNKRKKKKPIPIKRSNDSSDADSEPEEDDQEDKMLKKDSGIGLSSSSGNTLQ